MKRTFLALCAFIMVFAAFSYSGNFPKISKNSAEYHKIESNYLKGLNSDNSQLKISCAYFLGEMQSNKAVIPLMAMFHNSKNDAAKLIAAWSLLKIGDARGVNLVKRALDLDECSSSAGCVLHCLYMDYSLHTNGRIDRYSVVKK